MIEAMLREEKRQFTATHHWEPFGVELEPFGNDSTDNKYRFTGQERDSHTNFDYMHFRFYASSMGRFLKPDNIIPDIKSPQSFNAYAYVNGNPVNLNDPTGHLYISSSLMSYISLMLGGTSATGSGAGIKSETTVAGGGSNGTSIAPVAPGDPNFIGPTLPIPGSPSFVGPPEAPFIIFDGNEITLFSGGDWFLSYEARSGKLDAAGNTQPQLQNVEDVGPIPEGIWSFNTKDIQHWSDLTVWQKVLSYIGRGQWPGGSSSWGKERVFLQPITYRGTRTGFSIHGGEVFGSIGCIDLATSGSTFFANLPTKPTFILLFVRYD